MVRKMIILCTLLLLSFTLTLVSPALATSQDNKLVRVYSILDDKPAAKPGKPPPSTASVNIRNLATGDTVCSKVPLRVIAQVTGVFDSVVCKIGTGPEMAMGRIDSSDRYQADYVTSGLSPKSTLTVRAKSGGNVVASASASLTVVNDYLWNVNFEIDYMVGHEPSQSVLEYMMNYWGSRGVLAIPVINDTVFDPSPGDGIISETDFWILEKENNDGVDNSNNGYDYFSSSKWMLYGTFDSNSNVGGYTYVATVGKDLVAGNYIFIADGMIANWEASYGIPSDGGEAIVTCHEVGHSIGIAVLQGASEKYDVDYYSIMSYMRLQNAKDMAGYWYYSKEYWSTANLNYYLYPSS